MPDFDESRLKPEFDEALLKPAKPTYAEVMAQASPMGGEFSFAPQQAEAAKVLPRGTEFEGVSRPFVPIPRISQRVSLHGQIGAGVVNTLAGFGEFLESPLGLSTATLGTAGPIARRLIAGGFAAQMGAEAPAAARRAGEASVTGTPQEQTEADLAAAANVILPGFLGEAALKPSVALPRAAKALAEEPGAEPPATAPESAPTVVPPEPVQPAPSTGAQPIEVPDAALPISSRAGLSLEQLPGDRPQVDPQIRLGAQGEAPPAEAEVPAKAEDVTAEAAKSPESKPAMFFKEGSRLAQVTEEQAFQAMKQLRERTGLGASQLPDLLLYDVEGKPIGYVSYNGRVWLDKLTAKPPESVPAEPAAKPSPEPPATYTATLYQGRGASLKDVYGPEAVAAGRAVPILGKADYFTHTKEDAKIYGNAITEHEVKLSRPLKIDSDASWRRLLQDAGTMVLDSRGREWYEHPERIAGAGKKLQSYLRAKGHDGVIIEVPEHADMNERGEVTKSLAESFGHSQVVRFARAEPPAAPAEAPTPPAEAQAKVEAPKRPPAKIPTAKEVDLAGTHYESALRLYGPQNRETQRRHSRYIELTLERKEGLAARKAAATKPPPDSPTTPGPGAATRGAGPYPAVQQLTDQLNATPPAGVKARIAWGERVADKWAAGKDAVTRAVGHVVNVTQTLRGIARGVRSITDLERKHGEFDFSLQKSASQSFEAGRALERQMPNVADREAAALLIDSGGNTAALQHALANLPAGTKPSVRRALERAVHPSPELIQFTEGLKQYYGIREQDAKASDLFEDGLRDYYTHIWKKEGNMPDSLRGAFASGKVQTYFQFARQRTIPTFLEGILAGKTPILDPAQVVPFYNFAMDRSIASRELVRALSEVTASDGRPLADVAGVGATVDPGAAGDPTVFIRPKSAPEAIRDYKTIDNPAMQKWKWKAQAPDGTPIILKGELRVHPEAYERLARLMEKSRLTPTALTRFALKIGSEAKGLKFGTLPSPFHVIHVGSHALLHWTNPFSFKGRSWIEADTGAINWDHPIVREAVEKGHLRIGISPGELSIVAEGLGSGSWARALGNLVSFGHLGEWAHTFTRWMFQDYIPKLKMATYESAVNRARWAQEHLGLFKGLSDEQIIARTGDAVNNAYGELNHAFIGKAGRDPRLQRFLRVATLAPDFGEARLRFAEKALTRYGHEERLAFVTLAATAYVAARVANQVSHGNSEWNDPKNALRVKVGEKWWSMRSVMGDIIHAVSNPRQFLYVRLNPATTQRAWDAFAGRDVNTGRKLSWKDGVERAAQTVVPIQFGGLTREDQTFMDGFAQSFGFSPQRDTPEQDIKKLAADWRSKNGLGSPEEFVPNDSPSYQRLRSLIRVGADHRAAEMIGELRKTHSDKQIEKAMSAYLHHPFTGSKEHESTFMSTLTPEQQRLYYQAREEEIRTRDQFYKLLSPMLK